MKKKCGLLVGVCIAFAACADTWMWTGAEDGFWTNAANWTVGGAVATVPPGMYADQSTAGAQSGALDSTARFGAVAEGCATTVNLDGFWDVSNLVVQAGAPRYTFGTSETQSLTIHATAGVFRVEAGAPAPTMVAQFGAWRYAGRSGGDLGSLFIPKLVNDSSETLTFPKMFYIEQGRSGEKAFRFEGSGDVKISGLSTFRYVIYLDLAQTNGAKLVWDCKVDPGWKIGGIRKIRNASGFFSEIEITEGNLLSGYEGMGPFEIAGALLLSGDGTYRCNVGRKAANNATDGNLYVDQQNTIYGTISVQCKVDSVLKDDVYYGGWTHYASNGTTIFGSRNAMRGSAKLLAYTDYSGSAQRPTFSVAAIGDEGVQGPLGYVGVEVSGGGRLLYTGEGETCTRPFCITNRVPRFQNATPLDQNPYGVIEQGGTGKLVFNSPITSYGVCLNGTTVKNATLELANSTAQEAEIGTALKDNADSGTLSLKKTGSGMWRLVAANAYTGSTTIEKGTLVVGAASSISSSSSIVMKGGALVFEGGGQSAVSLAAVSISSGANTISVPDGVTVSLSGLAVAGAATLDVQTEGSGALKVTGSSSLPGGVTINGKVAQLDENGTMIRRAYSIDVDIAARGGRIPNSAASTVGITSAGGESDGPVRLADGLSSATVAALVQKTATPATVELGSSQTLSAGTVAVMQGGESLTIGSAPGAGTLTPVSGAAGIEFDNRSDRELTVNATLSVPTSSTIWNIGEGLARLWWPANWAGTLDVMVGTLAVTNDANITFTSTLKGSGTLRKEGSGTWTMSKVQDGTYSGSFEIAGGTVNASSEKVFGAADSGTISVTNGGTLRASGTLGFAKGKKASLSGDGVDGGGAVVTSGSVYMPDITLAGDTRIAGTSGTLFFNTAVTPLSGRIDMNGHRLVKGGDSDTAYWQFNGTVVTNAGAIVFEPFCNAGNKWNLLYLYGDGVDIGDESAPAIEASNGTRLSLGETLPPQHRRIRIDADAGKVGPEMSFTGGMQRQADGIQTNCSHWAGSIEIVNADTWLSFHPWDGNYANRYITVSGQITGAGGVTLGKDSKSSVKGHVMFAHPNNTYAGMTKVYGEAAGSLSVFHLGSIPDWSKLLVQSGRVGLFVGDGFFSEADVLAAANSSATLNSVLDNGCAIAPAVFAVDTTYARGQTFGLALSDSLITRDSGFTLGHDGIGTLNVTGSWTKPVNFGCFDGSLVFSGNDRITLGAGYVTGDYSTTSGEMLIENVKDVRLVGGNSITVGGYANVLNAAGRMTIRNSNVTRTLKDGASDWISQYDGTLVGFDGSGVLNIEGENVITSRHVVGFIRGFGSLRQRGGRVTDRSYASNKSVAFGHGGYGYQELTAGDYEVLGILSHGFNNNSHGVLVQKGGRMHVKANESGTIAWYVAYSSNNVAQLTFSGGTVTNDWDTTICAGIDSRAYITVDGGEFICRRPANANRCKDGNSLTVFNLNSGVFGCWSVAKANAEYADGANSLAIMNFNGGTFRATGVGYSLFGYSTGGNWAKAIDRVTVYEGGATIDVPDAAQSGSGTRVDVPLSAPTGRGVASVAWSDTGVNYVGAPVVEIIGDGTGASAVAEFDSLTETVTGIKVTSPGCDYTWAKALIRYGNLDVVTNSAVTLAEFGSGSFRKTGPGRLSLNVANSYTGDTVIEDGELVVNAEGAIPAGSQIVLKGGRLTAGGGVALPAATFRFDLLTSVSYPGAFRFPSGASILIDNLDKADKSVGSYTLATFADGLSGDTPAVANEAELPSGWRVSFNGGKVMVRCIRGAVFSLR